MDKLLEQFKKLMEDLKKANPELYKRALGLLGKIQDQYVKQYGKLPFAGWIDPLKPP
jgi:hypothetical protein